MKIICIFLCCFCLAFATYANPSVLNHFDSPYGKSFSKVITIDRNNSRIYSWNFVNRSGTVSLEQDSQTPVIGFNGILVSNLSELAVLDINNAYSFLTYDGLGYSLYYADSYGIKPDYPKSAPFSISSTVHESFQILSESGNTYFTFLVNDKIIILDELMNPVHISSTITGTEIEMFSTDLDADGIKEIILKKNDANSDCIIEVFRFYSNSLVSTGTLNTLVASSTNGIVLNSKILFVDVNDNLVSVDIQYDGINSSFTRSNAGVIPSAERIVMIKNSYPTEMKILAIAGNEYKVYDQSGNELHEIHLCESDIDIAGIEDGSGIRLFYSKGGTEITVITPGVDNELLIFGKENQNSTMGEDVPFNGEIVFPVNDMTFTYTVPEIQVKGNFTESQSDIYYRLEFHPYGGSLIDIPVSSDYQNPTDSFEGIIIPGADIENIVVGEIPGDILYAGFAGELVLQMKIGGIYTEVDRIALFIIYDSPIRFEITNRVIGEGTVKYSGMKSDSAEALSVNNIEASKNYYLSTIFNEEYDFSISPFYGSSNAVCVKKINSVPKAVYTNSEDDPLSFSAGEEVFDSVDKSDVKLTNDNEGNAEIFYVEDGNILKSVESGIHFKDPTLIPEVVYDGLSMTIKEYSVLEDNGVSHVIILGEDSGNNKVKYIRYGVSSETFEVWQTSSQVSNPAIMRSNGDIFLSWEVTTALSKKLYFSSKPAGASGFSIPINLTATLYGSQEIPQLYKNGTDLFISFKSWEYDYDGHFAENGGADGENYNLIKIAKYNTGVLTEHSVQNAIIGNEIKEFIVHKTVYGPTLVWIEGDDTSDHVYFKRLSDSMYDITPEYSLSDPLVNSLKKKLRVVSDDNANLYIAWIDARNGSDDIYYANSTYWEYEFAYAHCGNDNLFKASTKSGLYSTEISDYFKVLPGISVEPIENDKVFDLRLSPGVLPVDHNIYVNQLNPDSIARVYYSGEDMGSPFSNFNLLGEADFELQNREGLLFPVGFIPDGRYFITAEAAFSDAECTNPVDETYSIVSDYFDPRITNFVYDKYQFNPYIENIHFTYNINENSQISVNVSDNKGLVNTIIDNEYTSGNTEYIVEAIGDGIITFDKVSVEKTNTFLWNGRDESGEVVENGIYYVRIFQRDLAGNSTSEVINVKVNINVGTPSCSQPPYFSYVAPLNQSISPDSDGIKDTATVNYYVNACSDVKVYLAIADDTGTVVKDLVAGEIRSIGTHTEIWDARNASGDIVPEGIYTYSLYAINTIGGALSSEIETGTVTIDITSPVISFSCENILTPNFDGCNDELDIAIAVNDNFDIYKWDLIIRDTLGNTDTVVSGGSTVESYVYTLSGDIYDDGKYFLKLYCIDKAGNYSETPDKEIVINREFYTIIAGNETVLFSDARFNKAPHFTYDGSFYYEHSGLMACGDYVRAIEDSIDPNISVWKYQNGITTKIVTASYENAPPPPRPLYRPYSNTSIFYVGNYGNLFILKNSNLYFWDYYSGLNLMVEGVSEDTISLVSRLMCYYWNGLELIKKVGDNEYIHIPDSQIDYIWKMNTVAFSDKVYFVGRMTGDSNINIYSVDSYGTVVKISDSTTLIYEDISVSSDQNYLVATGFKRNEEQIVLFDLVNDTETVVETYPFTVKIKNIGFSGEDSRFYYSVITDENPGRACPGFPPIGPIPINYHVRSYEIDVKCLNVKTGAVDYLGSYLCANPEIKVSPNETYFLYSKYHATYSDLTAVELIKQNECGTHQPLDFMSPTVELEVISGEEISLTSLSLPIPKSIKQVRGKVNVKVRANDNVGVRKVGLDLASIIVEDENENELNYIWDTEIVPNGIYKINAYAEDLSGNIGLQEETVMVNNTIDDNTGEDTLPGVILSSEILFEPFAMEGAETFVIEGTEYTVYTEEEGEIFFKYRIDNGYWTNYLETFDLAGYENGEHLIEYCAFDAEGNEEIPNSVRVNLADALSTEYSIRRDARLLVWLNGDYSDSEILSADRLFKEYNSQITSDRAIFEDEITEDRYDAVFILGDRLPVTGNTHERIKEVVANGKTVISSLWHHVSDPKVGDEVFGIKVSGKLGEDNIVQFITSRYSEEMLIQTQGKAYRVETSGELQSIFAFTIGAKPCPMATDNSYGEGKALFLNFDLVKTLNIEENIDYISGLVSGIIDQAITCEPDMLSAGDTIEVKFDIENNLIPLNIRIEEYLPIGIEVIDVFPAFTNGFDTWELHLGKSESINIMEKLQLLEGTFSHPLELRISYNVNGKWVEADILYIYLPIGGEDE
ncbi:hypothetical protein KAU32_11940 [bacterium]|nr:hypothetical protein [bacterium]